MPRKGCTPATLCPFWVTSPTHSKQGRASWSAETLQSTNRLTMPLVSPALSPCALVHQLLATTWGDIAPRLQRNQQ